MPARLELNYMEPSLVSSTDSKTNTDDDFRAVAKGFSTLLNLSAFLLLAEALLFLPYIQIPGLIGWALALSGFKLIFGQVNRLLSSQKIILLGIAAGLLAGLGPVVAFYIGTVTQLLIIPSVLLVLCASSLALLKNNLFAIVAFVTPTVTSFAVVMMQLDTSLPMLWPAFWATMGAMIIGVGYFCKKSS